MNGTDNAKCNGQDCSQVPLIPQPPTPSQEDRLGAQFTDFINGFTSFVKSKTPDHFVQRNLKGRPSEKCTSKPRTTPTSGTTVTPKKRGRPIKVVDDPTPKRMSTCLDLTTNATTTPSKKVTDTPTEGFTVV